MSKGGQTALGCLGIIVLLVIAGQCAGPSTNQLSENSISAAGVDNSLAASDTTEVTQAEPASNWRVSSSMDEVRGKSIHFAEVTSENAVDFDFPYAGGSRLTITVRKHPAWGEDVYFQISDGQFVCGIYDCTGTINFGSGPETLTVGPPEDHDSKTLFAKYGSAIIRKLKSSERVVVELPFYQEGNRQFTFKTKGLVWPPKT